MDKKVSIEGDEKIKIVFADWFKRPFWAYRMHMKNSIIPLVYSHQVKMDIPINKGERSGTALIPCTIYAMEHSIDLNPALIKKKGAKVLAVIPPKAKYKYVKDETIPKPFYQIKGTEIWYNPIHIVLKVTEQEKQDGYGMCGKHSGNVKKKITTVPDEENSITKIQTVEYHEFERCDKCHQKVVVSEVKQTRYRSCPSINVKLGDLATQDTIVPVQFGFNKSDVTAAYWIYPLMITAMAMMGAFLWGYDLISVAGEKVAGVLGGLMNVLSFTEVSAPAINTQWVTLTLKILATAMIFFWLIPRSIYKGYSILRWYHSVKHSVVQTKKTIR